MRLTILWVSGITMSTRLKLDYASSVFPTELYCHILSDVSALFPEDQYEPTRDKGFSYTRAEARFKTCFLSYSLVCRRWHELVQPYLHRVTAIRAGEVEKRFAYSTPLQGVLKMLDLQPHLSKHVRHLRLLPPNRHTQIRDPVLLPRILGRFTKLHTLELVNLDFTPQSIQEHLCDLDSIKDKYITNPLKLDRFAIYATAETILPINAIIFLLLLVSEAKSFLLQTEPKTMWSVYANSGSAQAANMHNLGTSFIPRRGCLRTTSFSLKSCSLPFDIVQYLVWAGTFQSNTITKFYLQADHQRLRNFYTHFRPAHPHLLELTLDLSRYVVPYASACNITSSFCFFVDHDLLNISGRPIPHVVHKPQKLTKTLAKGPLSVGGKKFDF